MSERITIKQFVARESITITSDYVDQNPHMNDDHAMNHYKVKLSRKFGSVKRSMSLYFSMGLGRTDEPTVEDVLVCLAFEAAGIANARDFDDWARNYGYDTDRGKGMKTYKACERSTQKLQQFLGDDAYNQLFTSHGNGVGR